MLVGRGDASGADAKLKPLVDKRDAVLAVARWYAWIYGVLSAAGETAAARDALEQALERYERKRDLPDAARVRAQLAQLEDVSRSPQRIDPGSQG